MLLSLFSFFFLPNFFCGRMIPSDSPIFFARFRRSKGRRSRGKPTTRTKLSTSNLGYNQNTLDRGQSRKIRFSKCLGSGLKKFSELCVLLFFLRKKNKTLPKPRFSKPTFGHSAESTKLDRPYCKRFWYKKGREICYAVCQGWGAFQNSELATSKTSHMACQQQHLKLNQDSSAFDGVHA